jgi:hypothetical protein
MGVRWRDPRVAPVYASLVTFAVVTVFGLVGGRGDDIPQVRLVAQGVDTLPAELAGAPIEVREPGGAAPVASGQFTQGSYAPAEAVSGRLLCVRLPAPWTLAGAVDGCVTAPEPRSGQVRLTATKAVVIQVRFADGDTGDLRGLVVTVRGTADPDVSESGRTTDAGSYQPQRSLAQQAVCLRVPDGYRVSEPRTTERDGLSCTSPITEPAKDVVLTLKRGIQ